MTVICEHCSFGKDTQHAFKYKDKQFILCWNCLTEIEKMAYQMIDMQEKYDKTHSDFNEFLLNIEKSGITI